jgi:hypothetical protein
MHFSPPTRVKLQRKAQEEHRKKFHWVTSAQCFEPLLSGKTMPTNAGVEVRTQVCIARTRIILRRSCDIAH